MINVAPVPRDITEYSRSHWKLWVDEDGDCQNARQEVLVAESLVEVSFKGGKTCEVETGRWYGAFKGSYVDEPGKLDIDHLVPLKNAHDSGGWRWSADRKREYANFLGDPDHLIAVTAGANRSKGAKGPEAWRPPDEGYWCRYAVDWTEVKFRWTLTMTEAEAKAVLDMLDTCTNPPEVDVKVATGRRKKSPRLNPRSGRTGPAKRLRAPERRESRAVREEAEAFRRRWFPAPATATATVSCVNSESLGYFIPPPPGRPKKVLLSQNWFKALQFPWFPSGCGTPGRETRRWSWIGPCRGALLRHSYPAGRPVE